jgi:CHC2 zinc finger
VSALAKVSMHRRPISCEAVARAARGDPIKREGKEICFRCPHHLPDNDPSLKINPHKNCWSCFPCSAGGNSWQLVAFLLGTSPDDKPAIVAWLRDHELIEARPSENNNSNRARPVKAPYAPKGFTRGVEIYYEEDLRKVRFNPLLENVGARKKFYWQHKVGDRWLYGQGGLEVPLYGNACFFEPDQLDYCVGFEGEAKADLAEKLNLPGFSFKESIAKHCACFGDLDVILWPDKNTSGDTQATAAANLLAESGQPRRIRMIVPPAELPDGGDIIDAVKTLGWGRAEIKKLIDEAKPFAPAAPIEIRTPAPKPKPTPTPAPAPASTPRRKSALKCFFDFRKLPLESFRLPGDKRKVRQLCLERRAVAVELASYANADGTQIHVSAETIAVHTRLSVPTVWRRLHDLYVLKMLASKRRGYNRSCDRTLVPPSTDQHP